MTREEALKWSELLKAISEGKEVQYSPNLKVWEGLNPDGIIMYSANYVRIKPEPKYIPYTWEDWKEFMGKELLYKLSDCLNKITGLSEQNVCILYNGDTREWLSYQFMFDNYTYIDGTPFGKLVEE